MRRRWKDLFLLSTLTFIACSEATAYEDFCYKEAKQTSSYDGYYSSSNDFYEPGFSPCADCLGCCGGPQLLMWNFGTGFREDGLHFVTAGQNNIPNIESEKKWKHVKVLPFSSTLTYLSCNGFYARGYADYGRIYDGNATDFVWDGDNKTDLVSNRTGCADRGEVFDISGGIGYMFHTKDNKIGIGPLVGYAHNEQHVQIYDIYEHVADIGILDDERLSFRPAWRGPWVGVDFSWGPICRTHLYGGWEYHWVLYRADGKEHGADDFERSYKHKADGYGQAAWIGFDYEVCRRWTLGMQGSYQSFWSKEGCQISKRKDLDPEVRTKVKLNKSEWHSFTALITVGYQYYDN